MDDLSRFLGYVVKTDTCWLWTGSTRKKGYGYISFKGKPISAHRFSWIFFKGKIPRLIGYHGNCVLHKCDTPSCVNPEHLFLGTMGDNVRDMFAKGRSTKPCKLSRSQVNSIREIYKKTGCTQQVLADVYGVSSVTICQIINFKIWKK